MLILNQNDSHDPKDKIKCTDNVIGSTVLKITTYLVTSLHDGIGVFRRASIIEKSDYSGRGHFPHVM